MAYDAVIVGSGPNGLSAAIVLAQAGHKVAVFEAESQIGGGSRSAELTLPGFTHDICSAIHPFALASPFFRTLPLERYGLDWIQPPVMVAHPLDDGDAAIVEKSIDATARGLGRDAQAYTKLMTSVVDDWDRLEQAVLGPPRWPRHPIALARFGLRALRSIGGLIDGRFVETRTRALFGGHAAHGMLPLDHKLTAGFGLTLGAMCHIAGWPMPRGGSQQIANALAAHLRTLGGEIFTDTRVTTIDQLPPARAILLDLSPKPILQIAGHRLPEDYRRKLEKYRYGMGAFKVDWALDAPIPWTADGCRRAGTVHVAGTFEDIVRSERDAWEGRNTERPFMILSQPTLLDPSRAPAGKHVVWAYCHVPHGSRFDMLDRVERQIERFAPGFRDRVLARAVMAPRDIESHNANMVGGDIGAGVSDLRQFFARPTWRTYTTPANGLYICSASTPPGVGVHGMCGYHAATKALRDVY
jgi:phytoene dehydrogenase-like protein